MQLSEKTLTVLDNFSRIYESFYFQKGKIQRTMTPNKTMFVEVELEDDIPQEFGIYKMDKFLQILSFFDVPEINFQGKEITIEEGDKKVTYRSCEKDLIKIPKGSLADVIKDFQVTFSIDKENLQSILKSAAVLEAKNIVLEGDGSAITIRAMDVDNTSVDTFTYKVCDSTEEFKAVLEVSTIRMLNHNYDVSISSKAVKFASSEMNLQYWYPVQGN